MRVGLARRSLSFSDRLGETAFAVIMVIIINGYVAISKLNTGFLYIAVVNLGACAAWGFVDGCIYFISSSIDRNTENNQLIRLKSLTSNESGITQAKATLEDTFLNTFDEKGKDAIAREIIKHIPNAKIGTNKIITRKEAQGWLSIILLYLGTGFLLALPFLVLPNKINAWLISNIAGCAWLFWYGTQLGRIAGRHRLFFGLLLAAFGIAFLTVSYIVWARP